MEHLYKLFLYIHIVAGFTALASSIIPISSKKGGKTHRISGKVFFWSMVFTTISAVAIAIYKTNYFLFYIGIFSFYFAFAGNRIVRITKESKILFLDNLVFCFSAVCCAAMIVFAALQKNVVLFIFSLIFLMGIRNGFVFYRSAEAKRKENYLLLHLQFMLGACIATFTAFLVVNIKMQPAWLPWIAPTIIGSVLITIWTAKLKKRLKRV